MNLILASASPRRREILTTLGLDFTVTVPDADESSDISDPAALVRELALRKGLCVRDKLRGSVNAPTLIISSDTLVWCSGEILGKPHDRDDARRMLRLLSGREHTVLSGIALTLMRPSADAVSDVSVSDVSVSDVSVSDVSTTKVRFGEISEHELELYLSHCHYMDKAGAYAIQEGASLFIDGIEGDFFTVMGLPVRCMYRLASRELGIDLQALCHRIN